MGLLDLKPEQRIRKIQMIHTLLLNPVQKNLIMSIMDHFQLSAGISTSILSTTNQPLGYVSSTWCLDLINFCQKYYIKSLVPNSLCFTLQRTNDKNIMDELIQTKLKETQLRRINACRMFLNSSTLAISANLMA